MNWFRTSTRTPTDASAPSLTVEQVHAAHGDFVWASLQRMGVRERDLEDVFQEVFVVVHQRLHTFEGRSRMTTWLFGVCLKVAAAHRRRAYVRNEAPTEDVEDGASEGEADPEEQHARAQERAVLAAVLDELDVEKRAVFVMTELEELAADEIATIMGVPVGTVYSRLHAARRQFEQAAARHRARAASARGGAR